VVPFRFFILLSHPIHFSRTMFCLAIPVVPRVRGHRRNLSGVKLLDAPFLAGEPRLDYRSVAWVQRRGWFWFYVVLNPSWVNNLHDSPSRLRRPGTCIRGQLWR
jgi:hypothetical protein